MNNPQPWWLMWPAAEVAAAILPLFPYPASAEEADVIKGIAWCQPGRKFQHEKRFDDPDMRAILEAMRILDHAHLLMQTVVNSRTAHLSTNPDAYQASTRGDGSDDHRQTACEVSPARCGLPDVWA